MGLLIYIISLIARILIFLLFARAILSWFVGPYSGRPNNVLSQIYNFLEQVTEPLVRPFRSLLSKFNTGPVDFSLFLTMIVIIIIERILIRVLLFL